MTWFPYRRQAAWNSAGDPIETGVGAVYDVTDTTFATPLTVRQIGAPPGSGNGAVMPTVAVAGFLSVEFEAEAEEVYWKAGAALPVHLHSAKGMRDATVAASAAATSAAADASAAAADAAAAAALVSAPVDTAVDTLVANLATATRARLDSLYGNVSFEPVLDGPLALDHAALPVGGSARTGNIQTGTASVQINPAGAYEAFPGLCLCRDGSLLATWRSASAHGWAPGSATKAARSTDFGQTWSAPWTIYTNPAQDIGFGMLTVLSDGRIACIGQYRSAAPATGSLCIIMFSSDNGDTWTTPTVVPFTFTDYTYAAGNIVETADGTLVAIGYGKNTADTYTSTRAILSVDGGASWTGEVTIANGPTLSVPFNEAVVGTLPNGQIMALIRSEEATKKIYRSVSSDGGVTWAAPTALFEGWGRPAWAPLSSGGLVMTYRGNADLSHLYRTSWDNGVTWTSAKQMAGQTPNQSVYTQLEEISPGLVAVAYADDTPAAANLRFKYLMDGTGLSPLGDLSGDTYYSTTGLTPASGWTLAAASGYDGLAWRVKNGHVTIYGIAAKASFAANEQIATVPAAARPDRIIWQGNYRVDTAGAVRVVAAGTVNTVVYLHYPIP